MMRAGPGGTLRRLGAMGLTVHGVEACRCRLNVVPHTASATRLAGLRAVDVVNVEVDVPPLHVERSLAPPPDGSATLDLLRTGFLT